MRDPEPVARRPGGDDRLRGAARSLGVRPVRIEPEPERDSDRVRNEPQERNGAVDAAAHRHRDARRRRRGAKAGSERVRKRVDSERLAADGSRLDQRQSNDGPLKPWGIGSDDPIALNREPDERELVAACGISADLLHQSRVTALLCDGSTLYVARAST